MAWERLPKDGAEVAQSMRRIAGWSQNFLRRIEEHGTFALSRRYFLHNIPSDLAQILGGGIHVRSVIFCFDPSDSKVVEAETAKPAFASAWLGPLRLEESTAST